MNSQPWGSGPIQPQPPAREPILKVPTVALVLALSMLVLYDLQLRLPDDGLRWAFYPSTLPENLGWPGLVTAMFVHTSWAHAATNALLALIFAAPVARMLPGGRGLAALLVFYMGCGIVASLGYGIVHLNTDAPAAGASGAVCGLLGAGIRLILRPAWAGPRPLGDRQTLISLIALVTLSVIYGLIGYAPGIGGIGIGWEAHVVGMVAGYLAIGPLFRWSRTWTSFTG